jgi:hypothetical protein
VVWRCVFGQVIEISSLSNYDCICLVAHYNDAYDGEKNRVAPALAARGYTAEQLAQADTRLVERFNPVESCGIRFTRPFGNLKYDALGYVLKLFDGYERGCVPFPGSVSEQPAQIMEVFGVLKQLKQEVETKARASAQNGTTR